MLNLTETMPKLKESEIQIQSKKFFVIYFLLYV